LSEEAMIKKWAEQPMLRPRIEKVVVNLNVGKSGEPLEKAFKVLNEIAGQTPVKKNAKTSIREFGIRKGEPIACVVTLRRQAAIDFLKKILVVKDNKVQRSSFDDRGNFAFGLKEHIEIPGVKYDPDVGIFGMDVCVTLNRPGDRVADRRKRKARTLGVEIV
jgi:large subunit ribosomal protein L5